MKLSTIAVPSISTSSFIILYKMLPYAYKILSLLSIYGVYFIIFVKFFTGIE